MANGELTVTCEPCAAFGIIPDTTDTTVGIVCAACGGRGYRVLTFVPFSGRKERKGIKRVRRSGQGITAFSSAPSPDAGIPYTDFLKGKFP